MRGAVLLALAPAALAQDAADCDSAILQPEEPAVLAAFRESMASYPALDPADEPADVVAGGLVWPWTAAWYTSPPSSWGAGECITAPSSPSPAASAPNRHATSPDRMQSSAQVRNT